MSGADFDDYTASYEALLEEQLSFFDANSDYFARYKVEVMKAELAEEPKRILEFGCGIGRNLPYLKETFPGSALMGCDISQRSIKLAQERHPELELLHTLAGGEIPGGPFDVIFVACVYHHIPPQQRPAVTGRLYDALAPGGQLFIFEHNPYNPVTRKIVRDCPFDEGVSLLSPKESRGLLSGAGLEQVRSLYTLFFPSSLSWMRFTERVLRYVPLGGQYFANGKKPLATP